MEIGDNDDHSSDSNSNHNVSESELPSLSNSDSKLNSSLSSLTEMAFDPKEAREDIPDLIGKTNSSESLRILKHLFSFRQDKINFGK